MKYRMIRPLVLGALFFGFSVVGWANSQEIDYSIFLFDQTENDYVFKSVILSEYYLSATNTSDISCLDVNQRPNTQVVKIKKDELSKYQFHAKTLKISEGGKCAFQFSGGRIHFEVYSRKNKITKILQTTIDAYFRAYAGPRSRDISLKMSDSGEVIGPVSMDSMLPVIRLMD